MPLTAVYTSQRDSCIGLRADATQDDQGIDVPWSVVHRPARPAPLTCPMCGGRVVARVSPAGLRHYAHYRRDPDCPSAGESLEHLTWKTLIADAVRAAGWVAEFEVPGVTDDGQRFQSDVQAVRPATVDWREVRVGWEVQLASLTPDEAAARHDVYRTRCAAVCWVSPRAHQRPWMTHVPSVRVADDGSPTVVGGTCEGVVSLGRFVDLVLTRRWREWPLLGQGGPWTWGAEAPTTNRARSAGGGYAPPERRSKYPAPTVCHMQQHLWRGVVCWPAPGEQAGSSDRLEVAVCERSACHREASHWVEQITGHKGIYLSFDEVRARRAVRGSEVEE